MSKAHLKRHVAPKSWVLLRKEEKFVVRPNPGAHSAKLSMPITIVLKQLGYANTTKEVKKMLNTKEVLVDQIRVKDYKHPLGFMDVITLKDAKENCRCILDTKGRLVIKHIKDAKEATLKLCRINDKTILNKGKVQLNLSGNKNLLIEKDEYKVGDTVLIELPSQKISQHLKFEKGAMIFLTGGKHIGKKGVIENIEGNKVLYTAGNAKLETLKKYAFVIGKEKEIITIN